MLKFIGTNVVVSKGYEDKPALSFSEEGNSVRFRIGCRVYDTRAENNQRWINVTVKAFGAVCERIQKMKLKAGSFIHIDGRYDEDVWQDEATGETKRMPVVILSDVEYAYSGNGEGKKDNGHNAAAPATPKASQGASSPRSDNSGGFAPYDGNDDFF